MPNRDDMINMAREIGLIDSRGESCVNDVVDLVNFAQLVAAHEREECARLIETEREWRGKGWTSTLSPPTTEAIAAAIRARGTA